MEPGDRERFAHCLLAAGELYGREVSDAVASVWWDAVRSWDIDAVERAFRAHFSSPDVGQFMPKPADVLRVLQGTGKDGALVAWAKVDKAVRSVGTYASVAFDDPLIHRVIHDMGGWIGLGQKTEEEWPFIANEFRNRYQGYRSSGLIPEYPPRLIGIAEADNGRRGLGAGVDLVLVGDKAKAARVQEAGTDRPAVGFQRIDTGAALRLVNTNGSA